MSIQFYNAQHESRTENSDHPSPLPAWLIYNLTLSITKSVLATILSHQEMINLIFILNTAQDVTLTFPPVLMESNCNLYKFVLNVNPVLYFDSFLLEVS